MRSPTIKILITLLVLTTIPGIGFSNDPAGDTPWPIGFNTGEMAISRTLMNSYGDLNGGWSSSLFHAGIDIDATTGSQYCDEVRCVDGGYATLVESVEIPGSDGEFQYLVIICDELGGTVQNGWSYGHLDQPPFLEDDLVAEGELVSTMTPHIDTPHLHFKWTDWDDPVWSYCNPLKYLDPSPTFEDNYDWTFNPENNNPPFDHFFLEDMSYSAWENMSIAQTQSEMLDPTSLSGKVDFFFGVSLRGDGMPFGGGVGRNDLTSQKIKYDVVRELAAGEETLNTRHVFDFDCWLKGITEEEPDIRPQVLYFRHSMDALFGNDALAYCLTNSQSSGDWDGINTINESCWNTKRMVSSALDTENPVLAKYPDGSYRLDVLCYSFDEDYTFPASVDGVELHNFYPALKEVLVIDASTDGTYYRAIWEPNTPGLLAELNIVSDQPIPAGSELEVVLIFTEEMNTGSGSISASLGGSSLNNGVWTNSIVTNDTWTGEVTLPSQVTDQTYLLSVSASDTDNNDLMDPEGAGTVPGPTSDTHHSVTIGFPAISHQWTASTNSPILSSPKLADIDGDGVLDIVVQSSNGYVDVLDGSSGISHTNWPVSGGWNSSDPDVKASPAIVNLVGVASTSPEILAVHPSGCNGFVSDGTAISGWSGVYASDYEWHVMCSPVAGDINYDNDFEYVLGRQHDTSSTQDNVFYGHQNNGTSIWSKEWGLSESVSATPSLCDVDNDGSLEVLAVTDFYSIWNPAAVDDYGTLYCLDAATGVEEWSYYYIGMLNWSAIVTADLDQDPQIETIISSTAGGSVTHVIDGISGTAQYTKLTGNVYAGASIGDVDGDGDPDVVVSSSSSGGTLHCWDGATGDDLPGFPLSLGTYTKIGVSLADIDLDGRSEVVLAGMDGMLHAINDDGTEAGGFPVTVSSTALSGQPAVGDIDGDYRLEIIFGEEENSVLHCYEMGENSAYTSLPWPQFQNDACNTGFYSGADISPVAPPTGFSGTGQLNGSTFTVDLEWTLSVNDPDHPSTVPPADVISYRVYRKIPPRALELVGDVIAGTDEFTDVFSLMSMVSVIAYTVCASDGVNESEFAAFVKFLPFGIDLISLGRPAREIVHSAEIGTSSSQASASLGRTESARSLIEGELGSNSRILTDGDYDTVYYPGNSSSCVEIDLGSIFTISDVFLTRSDESLIESCRYEVSADGRSFSSITDSERTRFVRVYGAAGATEVEVYGTPSSTSASPIELQRSSSDGYRIIVAEEGSPITATVFDLSGRNVWQNTSSTREILWNRCSSSGNTVPNGVYLIMVESDDIETFTTKVVIR